MSVLTRKRLDNWEVGWSQRVWLAWYLYSSPCSDATRTVDNHGMRLNKRMRKDPAKTYNNATST